MMLSMPFSVKKNHTAARKFRDELLLPASSSQTEMAEAGNREKGEAAGKRLHWPIGEHRIGCRRLRRWLGLAERKRSGERRRSERSIEARS